MFLIIINVHLNKNVEFFTSNLVKINLNLSKIILILLKVLFLKKLNFNSKSSFEIKLLRSLLKKNLKVVVFNRRFDIRYDFS